MALPIPKSGSVVIGRGPGSEAQEWGCFFVLIPGGLAVMIALVATSGNGWIFWLWGISLLLLLMGFSSRYILDLRRQEISTEVDLVGLTWRRRLAGFRQLLSWELHDRYLRLNWLDLDGVGRQFNVGICESTEGDRGEVARAETERFLQSIGLVFLSLEERVVSQKIWTLPTWYIGYHGSGLGCLAPFVVTAGFGCIEIIFHRFRTPNLDIFTWLCMVLFLVGPLWRVRREYLPETGLVRELHCLGSWGIWPGRSWKVGALESDEAGQLWVVSGQQRWCLGHFHDNETAQKARSLLLEAYPLNDVS